MLCEKLYAGTVERLAAVKENDDSRTGYRVLLFFYRKDCNMLNFYILIRTCILLLLMSGTVVPVYAAKVFDNRLPKPKGLRKFSTQEFAVNLDRIRQRGEGHIYGDKDALLCFGSFLLETPEGRRCWDIVAGQAARTLDGWDFLDKNKRYIVRLHKSIEDLALVYMYSGHKELGQFIRGHLLLAADLPPEFWLHSELRSYYTKRQMGGLETAHLAMAYAATLSFVGDLLSETELETCRNALHEKAYVPVMNWFKLRSMNNWRAVMGSAAYVCGTYFNDAAGKDKAFNILLGYLNGSFEDDGSYGEGGGYFSYPVISMLSAISCMDKESRTRFFTAGARMKNSLSWLVYPYLFNTDINGRALPAVTHFGDNGSSRTPHPDMAFVLAWAYDDGLGSWLVDKFRIPWRSRKLLLLLEESDKKLPPPKSPDELGLPLVKNFRNGDCFIRSSWKDNGIVLALRSGKAGGSKVKYSHQRPEFNSICMGAYGEYLIVSPGSASYRGELHHLWDMTTRSGNTIVIDDKNQLFPGRPGIGKKYASLKVDMSSFWVEGKPAAEVLECRSGEIADILVNEAAKAYPQKLKHARRCVVFVRDPGYFVVIDHLVSIGTKHKYAWYMHFNNRDGKGTLSTVSENCWLLKRPLASLLVYVSADVSVESMIGKGYMHGPIRDYMPGGKNEGKLGSSLELGVWNGEKSREVTYMSILYPFASGGIPTLRRDGRSLQIDGDVIEQGNGVLTIEQNKKKEEFRLW
jgi:hypothetical protein